MAHPSSRVTKSPAEFPALQFAVTLVTTIIRITPVDYELLRGHSMRGTRLDENRPSCARAIYEYSPYVINQLPRVDYVVAMLH